MSDAPVSWTALSADGRPLSTAGSDCILLLLHHLLSFAFSTQQPLLAALSCLLGRLCQSASCQLANRQDMSAIHTDQQLDKSQSPVGRSVQPVSEE